MPAVRKQWQMPAVEPNFRNQFGRIEIHLLLKLVQLLHYFCTKYHVIYSYMLWRVTIGNGIHGNNLFIAVAAIATGR